MTHYNVIAELDVSAKTGLARIDGWMGTLVGHSAAAAASLYGKLEVTITLPADDVAQAVSTAVALIERASGRHVQTVQALPTEEFDRRLGLEPIPELVSVSEAADLLGISRQRVLQLVEAGRLPASKVGNAVILPRVAVEAHRAASS